MNSEEAALERFHLTEEQIAELRHAFEAMDLNHDGVVTREELEISMKKLGEKINKKIIDRMINAADENEDGLMQFEEFVKAAVEGK